MKCVICRKGETQWGNTTVTLEREASVLVFRKVPAQICSNCGEEYVDEKTTAQLLECAEDAIRAGIQVDIRQYMAA